MRSDVKSELAMCREIAWIYLHDKKCYFCGCSMLLPPKTLGSPPEVTWGHRHHYKILIEVTFHHINENREDNSPGNRAVCHSACHRSHHTRKRSALRKEIIKRYEENQENQETEEVLETRSLLNE